MTAAQADPNDATVGQTAAAAIDVESDGSGGATIDRRGGQGQGGAGAGAGRGEFDLIRRFFDRGPVRDALLGIGDDCALLAPRDPRSVLAVSTDLLLEGRHFAAGVDPVAIGHKSLAVNLSDLAAIGALPRAFTLALALPQYDEAWLSGFCAGLFALADRHRCELIGGDTTRGPRTICITVFGEVPAATALRRDGAQPGDDLWVSGTLGAAARAVEERARAVGEHACAVEERARVVERHAHVSAGPAAPSDPAGAARLDYPQPRIELGLALRHLARSAIDLSDGLLGDLAHITERSRVGAEVDWPSVPADPCLGDLPENEQRRLALAGGDDYELLFSAAPENRTAIAAIGARLALPLTRIGRIVDGSTVRVLDARGRPLPMTIAGYDHFGTG